MRRNWGLRAGIDSEAAVRKETAGEEKNTIKTKKGALLLL